MRVLVRNGTSRSSIVILLAGSRPSAASIFETSPTSTPASRTGAPGLRFWASRTRAVSSWSANGFDLVNPK